MWGIQVTLTDANTNYSLLTLLRAVESTIPSKVRELTIQAETTNTGDVLVGDPSLSATRFGLRLSAGDSHTRRGDANTVALDRINARSATAAMKLNVDVAAY